MISTIRRVGLGLGAAVMAVGLTVTAASIYADAQNSSQDPGSGRPGHGGPDGGPGRGRFGGPGGRGGWMGVLGPMALERLGLTDSQREQVKAVVQSHDDERKALTGRAFTAHQALEAAVLADVPDEGAIRAKSADVAAVEADLAVIRARIHAEVFQVLTPEQRAKARELAQRTGDRRPPPR